LWFFGFEFYPKEKVGFWHPFPLSCTLVFRPSRRIVNILISTGTPPHCPLLSPLVKVIPSTFLTIYTWHCAGSFPPPPPFPSGPPLSTNHPQPAVKVFLSEFLLLSAVFNSTTSTLCTSPFYPVGFLLPPGPRSNFRHFLFFFVGPFLFLRRR